MKFDFDDVVYYDIRAHVKHAAGQYPQAISDYREAIRKKPTCAVPLCRPRRCGIRA